MNQYRICDRAPQRIRHRVRVGTCGHVTQLHVGCHRRAGRTGPLASIGRLSGSRENRRAAVRAAVAGHRGHIAIAGGEHVHREMVRHHTVRAVCRQECFCVIARVRERVPVPRERQICAAHCRVKGVRRVHIDENRQRNSRIALVISGQDVGELELRGRPYQEGGVRRREIVRQLVLHQCQHIAALNAVVHRQVQRHHTVAARRIGQYARIGTGSDVQAVGPEVTVAHHRVDKGVLQGIIVHIDNRVEVAAKVVVHAEPVSDGGVVGERGGRVEGELRGSEIVDPRSHDGVVLVSERSHLTGTDGRTVTNR